MNHLLFLCISLSVFSLSVCQNLCFILPQFLYQFFCGYSQQVSIVLRPFEVQRYSEHERRQCPLNPHLLVLFE